MQQDVDPHYHRYVEGMVIVIVGEAETEVTLNILSSQSETHNFD